MIAPKTQTKNKTKRKEESQVLRCYREKESNRLRVSQLLLRLTAK